MYQTFAIDPAFETKHPRAPEGTAAGGRWVPKPDAAQATSAQWYATLGADERKAMDDWVTGQSFMTDVHVEEREGGATSPAVQRFYDAVARAPEAHGVLYRGIGGLDDAELTTLLEREFTLDQTTSFSASERTSRDFAAKRTFDDEAFVLLKVADGHGARDVSAANRYGEREALLPPGTRLRKVSSRELKLGEKYGYVVTVRVVQ